MYLTPSSYSAGATFVIGRGAPQVLAQLVAMKSSQHYVMLSQQAQEDFDDSIIHVKGIENHDSPVDSFVQTATPWLREILERSEFFFSWEVAACPTDSFSAAACPANNTLALFGKPAGTAALEELHEEHTNCILTLESVKDISAFSWMLTPAHREHLNKWSRELLDKHMMEAVIKPQRDRGLPGQSSKNDTSEVPLCECHPLV